MIKHVFAPKHLCPQSFPEEGDLGHRSRVRRLAALELQGQVVY